jgi:hypothetical protein
MPSPEFTERAKNFQRTFAPYFPDLSDNFHAACVGTEYLWDARIAARDATTTNN